MAKKRRDSTEEAERKTRKDILIARKEAQQTRRIRLAMGGVALLLGLILVIAIVNELFVAPNRPVAVVSGEEIGLREWQNRVRYERAQRILLLENQLEAFGGDVGIIQQFAGQMILDLQNAETIGQDVLDQMVNELAVRQMARVRGLSVTEAEAEEELGASFNYFGGDSPTPFPTPTNTVVPTPSLTPVPTSVITELLPTATVFPTFTPGPTSAPPATATPVSRESFEEQFDELLSQFNDYGVDEETYRSVVRQQLLQEKLLEQVATENELPDEAPHASIYDMSFADEETAAEAAALIEAEDFLTVWNTLRTAPSELDIQGTASELLWRTQEQLAASLGEEVAQAAFTINLNEPSDVLVQTIDDENSRFHLIQVSGREVRKLSTSALAQDKAELLSTLIDQYLTGNLETTNFWRGRVPTQPVLDPKFLAAPTATPLAIPSPAPTVAGGS